MGKALKKLKAEATKVKQVITEKDYDEVVKFVPDAFESMMNEAFDTTTNDGAKESVLFFDLASRAMMTSHDFIIKAYNNMDIDQSQLFGYIYRTNVNAAHIIKLSGDILNYVQPEAEANATGIIYYDDFLNEEVELEPYKYAYTLEQSVARFASNVWDSGLRIHGLKEEIENQLRRFVARDIINAIRIDREDLNHIEIVVHINKKIDRRTLTDVILRRKVTAADVNITDVKIYINSYKVHNSNRSEINE